MLGICSSCGNHEWDKEVEGNKIRCPKCGNEWTFEKLPIYFLTVVAESERQLQQLNCKSLQTSI